MRMGVRKHRARAFAFAIACLVLAGFVHASPAAASPGLTLKSSRTCVRVGMQVRLTATVPSSLLPAPSAPTGSATGTSSAGASGSPVTADLVAYWLNKGVWRCVSTRRISNNVVGSTLIKNVAPCRGRYRYVVRIASSKGTTQSNAVEFAVVGAKVVALTFDDGPWPKSTAGILAVLAQKDVRATFFMCGYALAAYPKLGTAVVNGRQEVGNHTYTHANLVKLSDTGIKRELTRTQDLIKKVLGVTPRWCRPPYGSTSTRVKSLIESLGMEQVIWNVDPLDWKRPGASVVVSRVVGAVRPGYVVLMHDGGGDRSGTAAAVPVIIDRLRADDYDFVTMPELAEIHGGR